MKQEAGSPWLAEARTSYPSLDRDVDVDVAVIGGGICGVTCAYLLAKAGQRVALIDKGRIGEGETGYTTAFLSKEIELPLPELVRKYGEAKARDVWNAGQSAIEAVARIAGEEKIACDLVLTPATAVASDDRGSDRLREEARLASRLGFSANYADGRLRLDGEGKFHPLGFIRGLMGRIGKEGGALFEKTPAQSILRDSRKLMVVTKTGKRISAPRVVIATHAPDRKLVAHDFHLKPFQTFAIETRLPSGMMPEGTSWDTVKPFHYWRVDRMEDHDRLILGGEDTAEKPDPKKAHANLLAFARTLTDRSDLTIERAWGGQLYETEDGLPVIGEVPGMPNVFVATGFSGNGMTWGVHAASCLTRRIVSGDELCDFHSGARKS